MNNVAIVDKDQSVGSQVVEFKTILAKLTEATELLKIQKQDEAAASISAMSDAVDYL